MTSELKVSKFNDYVDDESGQIVTYVDDIQALYLDITKKEILMILESSDKLKDISRAGSAVQNWSYELSNKVNITIGGSFSLYRLEKRYSMLVDDKYCKTEMVINLSRGNNSYFSKIVKEILSENILAIHEYIKGNN